MKKVKLIISLIVAGAGVWAFPGAVSAGPITGSIGFGGTFTTDSNADFTLATSITFSDVTTLGAASGDYAGVPAGTPTTFSGFSIASPPPYTLWSFTSAGTAYSFEVASIFGSVTPISLTLHGGGIASIDGFDDTPGSWIVTANSLGANFTFSSSAAVPDGGNTAILLGIVIMILPLSRRFRNR